MNNEFRNMMVEQTLHNYGEELFCIAYDIVRERETSKDMVQQTYVILLEKFYTIRKMDDEKVVKAFAIVTLKRLCFDYLRKQKHIAPMPVIRLDDEEDGIQLIDLIPDESESVEDTVILHLRIERLREVIKLLPDNYQNYIVLKHYFQYNDEKIAIEFAVQKNSVRMMEHRAKYKLKVLLEGQEVGN